MHGGIKPAELRAMGLTPEEVLDFSASISPLGPPAGIWDVLSKVDLAAYPDPNCLTLREALSRHLSASRRLSGSQHLSDSAKESVPVERILVGNGSTEIIHLLARVWLSPPRPGTGNTAFILTPTYGEYEGACRLTGAGVSCQDGLDRPGFRWDLDLATQHIARERPSLVFVCNPNNPTGLYLQQPEVETLADAASEAGGLLVLDEAYLSFVENPWDSLALLERGNVVLLRSMTKDYALTGLRLGFCLASEEVIRRLADFQPDWSVNAFAQAAGLAVLSGGDYLPRARLAVAEAKEFLAAWLTGLGFAVPPSAANFLLIQVGDAASWRNRLARRGLFVRDCASFGLPQYIRIGIRPLPDCQRLVEAMGELR